MKKALKKGDITIPAYMSEQRFENLLNKLGRKKWNVKIQDKYSHGNGVATYLARYLRGGPIKNSRIIKFEDGEVTFNYGRKNVELMTLKTEEFIKRYLQHVPLPRAVLVRSYGLYYHGKKDDLARCREFLGEAAHGEAEEIKWQDLFAGSEEHPELCPVCGKQLICTVLIKPTGKSRACHAPPHGKEWYSPDIKPERIAA